MARRVARNTGMDTKTCPACYSTIDARALKCSSCAARQPDAPMMHRNLPGRVMGGVCSALSLQLGWDPVVVRALFIASFGIIGPIGIWVYAILWLVTPFDALGKSPAKRMVDWASALFKVRDPEPATGPTDVL